MLNFKLSYQKDENLEQNSFFLRVSEKGLCACFIRLSTLFVSQKLWVPVSCLLKMLYQRQRSQVSTLNPASLDIPTPVFPFLRRLHDISTPFFSIFVTVDTLLRCLPTKNLHLISSKWGRNIELDFSLITSFKVTLVLTPPTGILFILLTVMFSLA